MNSVARMPANERALAFQATAERKGLPDAVVEKDFWVCWSLKQLFSIEGLSTRLLFKGGTSLSKVFHAIDRFSEDIDIAVDYAALGFTGERDPRQPGISKTRRASILAEMMMECQSYIRGEFLEGLRTRCNEILPSDSGWELEVAGTDPNVVLFRYPTAAAERLAYIRPQVILELGTHAEFVPRGRFSIRPFVAEEFPQFMPDGEARVEAILAKRTFWEKVTILHAEYYRPEDKPLPGRYSRHYYDVAMLAGGSIAAEARADAELLSQVVSHKEAFYPSGWARYDLARRGTLRVSPTESRIAALRRDYRDMADMIFGEQPSFELLLTKLAALETELNF
ncbi:nucleotidyl transferase AbiEii/AbiGii toxin family protein [Paludibaculum fermentans]|uniref:nucleotidyl transferase AbiEii/AbiGii toxin family protein n=1 Tax=Paludibaculum fermentans TaxID=1473598 RepID=UPI003EBAA05D